MRTLVVVIIDPIGDPASGHVIDDVQDAEPATAGELVVHKSSDQRAFGLASTRTQLFADIPFCAIKRPRLRSSRRDGPTWTDTDRTGKIAGLAVAIR
jgi:hypothetical protein